MSVTFNGIERLIEVTDPADLILDVEEDLYSEWKQWAQLGDNAKYGPAFRTGGGEPTSSGQFSPKYFFLINFWRVEITSGEVVNIALNLYSDDFDTPFIIGAGSGVINKLSDSPVTSGAGSGLTAEQDLRLKEIWQLKGLDIDNAMVVRDNLREVLSQFQLDISVDSGTGDITVQRL